MIDEENQQYQNPNSTGATQESSPLPSEIPVIPADPNDAGDWELELAKAYQSAQNDRGSAPASGETAVSSSSSNSPVADAQEQLKRELAAASGEKKP
ncbi:MAG: hypothetical protein HC786_14485 [Richelia sp. CSU_2_1]|nr:hypothetical protein [Richelia sp. CSU_2_1]